MKRFFAAVLILSACAPSGEAQDAALDAPDSTTATAQPARTDAAQHAMTDTAQHAAALDAHDRVRGLLSLPQVFGNALCEPFTPTDVTLYASADSLRAIGRIRVDTPWTIHPAGGCEGLIVRVHHSDADSTSELPTLEFSYEEPAAIVLQQNGPWFKIRLAEGSAWVRASEPNRFFPLPELLAENLTYVANPDGTGLAAAPGDTRTAAADVLTADRPVNVLESRLVGEQLWLRVAVQSHSVCEGAEEPTTVAEGWLPAHAANGEPTVWFYSRGC